MSNNIVQVSFIHGQEIEIVIEDVGRSFAKHGIMEQCYRKALDALGVYIKQTGPVRRKLNKPETSESQKNNILYRSPQNIFAFSGRRGAGKTSTMLSFTEFLSDAVSVSKEESLSSARFFVLNPIDPTALEEKQNILNTVLARILFATEEEWNSCMDFHRIPKDREQAKNALLQKASACMSGIRAVKGDGIVSSLAEIQKISDSAVLELDFYELVDMALEFCSSGKGSDYKKNNQFLVIPIDDTDCQIQKAYDVLEDIRRYLTIPNVIILMATDLEMLRQVFIQHFAEKLRYGMERASISSNVVYETAGKHFSKLVPVRHRIYLPEFEDFIKQSLVILLGYYEDESEDLDLISGTTKGEREKLLPDKSYTWELRKSTCLDVNFQAKILTYIFKKTGIYYAEHSAYINHMIPTTLRGMGYLLNFLHSMEEIKDLDVSVFNNKLKCADELEKQLRSYEYNLNQFEKYFISEWIPTKLPIEMVELLKGIAEQVPENIVNYTLTELLAKYYESPSALYESSALMVRNSRQRSGSYIELMKLLAQNNGRGKNGSSEILIDPHTKSEDYFCTFAVHTIFSIQNTRYLLHVKERMILKWMESRKIENPKFPLINYLIGTENRSFPDVFTEDGEIEEGCVLRILDAVTGSKYSSKESDDNVYIKFLTSTLNVIGNILSGKVTETKLDNHTLFRVQEIAGILFCDWDAQEIFCKVLRDFIQKKMWRRYKLFKGEYLFEEIMTAIISRNCGMLEKKTIDLKKVYAAFDFEKEKNSRKVIEKNVAVAKRNEELLARLTRDKNDVENLIETLDYSFISPIVEDKLKILLENINSDLNIINDSLGNATGIVKKWILSLSAEKDRLQSYIDKGDSQHDIQELKEILGQIRDILMHITIELR